MEKAHLAELEEHFRKVGRNQARAAAEEAREAKLQAQRDAKQKPIHQLELNVLQELAPQLDEVIRLELECKAANLELEMAEEEVEVVRRQVEQAKRQGAVEAEEDKRALVEVLNQRAAATEELEAVLMKLADNAEMREIQAEHEEHKKSMLKETHALQAELQGLEEQEQYERGTSEGGLDAAVHAATVAAPGVAKQKLQADQFQMQQEQSESQQHQNQIPSSFSGEDME